MLIFLNIKSIHAKEMSYIAVTTRNRIHLEEEYETYVTVKQCDGRRGLPRNTTVWCSSL